LPSGEEKERIQEERGGLRKGGRAWRGRFGEGRARRNSTISFVKGAWRGKVV